MVARSASVTLEACPAGMKEQSEQGVSALVLIFWLVAAIEAYTIVGIEFARLLQGL